MFSFAPEYFNMRWKKYLLIVDVYFELEKKLEEKKFEYEFGANLDVPDNAALLNSESKITSSDDTQVHSECALETKSRARERSTLLTKYIRVEPISSMILVFVSSI